MTGLIHALTACDRTDTSSKCSVRIDTETMTGLTHVLETMTGLTHVLTAYDRTDTRSNGL